MGIIKTIQSIFTPEPHQVTRYLDIFDDDGKRVTSLPLTQKKTMDDLKKEAAESYPGSTTVETDTEDHNRYVNGYLYDKETGKPKAPPEPTAEEKAAQEYAVLDNEYQGKVAEKEKEIQKAVIVLQDEELAAQYRTERAALVAEYTTKRQALVDKYKEV